MNGFIEEVRIHLKRIMARHRRFPPTAFRVRLRGTPKETCFQATIQVIWPVGLIVDVKLQSLAEYQLLKAAQDAASEYSILDPAEARIAIDLALCRSLYLAEEDVWLGAAGVTDISVDPADQRMAETQEALRRETALARAQQQQKLEQLRILGDQVLSDPCLAGLWWLDGKPDKLEKLVKLSGENVFGEAAALFSASVEQAVASPIPELVRSFLEGLSTDLQLQLIKQLHLVFTSYERDDLAEHLDSYQQTSAGASSPDSGDLDGRGPS